MDFISTQHNRCVRLKKKGRNQERVRFAVINRFLQTSAVELYQHLQSGMATVTQAHMTMGSSTCIECRYYLMWQSNDGDLVEGSPQGSPVILMLLRNGRHVHRLGRDRSTSYWPITALQPYLGHCRYRVASHRLYAFGIKDRLFLVSCFVHKASIPLLGL